MSSLLGRIKGKGLSGSGTYQEPEANGGNASFESARSRGSSNAEQPPSRILQVKAFGPSPETKTDRHQESNVATSPSANTSGSPHQMSDGKFIPARDSSLRQSFDQTTERDALPTNRHTRYASGGSKDFQKKPLRTGHSRNTSRNVEDLDSYHNTRDGTTDIGQDIADQLRDLTIARDTHSDLQRKPVPTERPLPGRMDQARDKAVPTEKPLPSMPRAACPPPEPEFHDAVMQQPSGRGASIRVVDPTPTQEIEPRFPGANAAAASVPAHEHSQPYPRDLKQSWATNYSLPNSQAQQQSHPSLHHPQPRYVPSSPTFKSGAEATPNGGTAIPQPKSLPPNFSMTKSDDTTVHEKFAPAVTHETVHHHTEHVVQEAITREIHQDHYYQYIQPLHVVEIARARHFTLDAEGNKVRIRTPEGWKPPSTMLPGVYDAADNKCADAMKAFERYRVEGKFGPETGASVRSYEAR